MQINGCMWEWHSESAACAHATTWQKASSLLASMTKRIRCMCTCHNMTKSELAYCEHDKANPLHVHMPRNDIAYSLDMERSRWMKGMVMCKQCICLFFQLTTHILKLNHRRQQWYEELQMAKSTQCKVIVNTFISIYACCHWVHVRSIHLITMRVHVNTCKEDNQHGSRTQASKMALKICRTLDVERTD